MQDFILGNDSGNVSDFHMGGSQFKYKPGY